MLNCTWEIPSIFPPLNSQEVHVWFVQLDSSNIDINYLFSLLTIEERNRALRFHFVKDKNNFIVARGLLRILLSEYLNKDPQAIEFHYNQYGKPFLNDNLNLQFNLSHCHNVALFTFVQYYEIGIDIESNTRQIEIDEIAQRFFSEGEYQLLKSLEGDNKRKAFFNGWARKEAFLKALGQGLSYSLAKVEFTLLPEQPAKFLAIHDNEQDINDWSVHELNPVQDYAAALVVKGKLQSIKTWQWN